MSRVNNYIIATILCLQIVCHSVLSTVGQYIYAFYLQAYTPQSNVTINFTETRILKYLHSKNLKLLLNDCSNNQINSTDDAQLWAQTQSADLFFRIDLFNSCPIVFMTYIIGLYTPRIGRRIVLILPMIGAAIQLAIWLAIIYFHLADYWWYVASFILGLSGSKYIFHFVLNLIITDNTTDDNRSFSFVLFEALTTATAAISTFAFGYYIEWRGFTDLYWIALGLEILCILICLSCFKTSTRTVDENTSLLPTMNSTDVTIHTINSYSLKSQLNEFMNIMKIFCFKKRSYDKSICLLLILLSYTFYLSAYSTDESFTWYLLDTPFCWSSDDIGKYNALLSITSSIFGLLGMKLFTCLSFSDPAICIFSHLCLTLSYIWIAFSRYSWQLYAGLLITPYGDYQNSLTLPMMSKWLEPHERNHAYTLVTEINTIISTFGNSIFNLIYSKTVAIHRNLALLIAAGFCFLAFVLNICLFGIKRRAINQNVNQTDYIASSETIETKISETHSNLLAENNYIVNAEMSAA